MKSQVSALLHVTRGILADVQAAYPALRGLDLDFERLALQCQTRDLSVFTLDLPHLDSLLIRGLDSGRLVLEGPFSRRVSKRIKVPRLFRGLWLRVFDMDACLKQDADVTSIFFLRQLCRLGKNLEVECSADRIKAAVENYYDIERRLRRPTLRWDSDRLNLAEDLDNCQLGDCLDSPICEGDLFPEEEKDTEALGSARLLSQIQSVADLIVGSWPRLDPLTYSGDLERDGRGIGFKHGLGAVAEKEDNWEKSQFSNWSAKLDRIFPWALCGTSVGSDLDRPLNHELASRLLCVPKTAKGPRLIAAEPTAQQWCQQLILKWFKDQFKESFRGSFIDLKAQWKSGDMVLQASRDRLLATVDLSDASDRLSCWTVERIFRKNPSLLSALHAARTRYIKDNISGVPNFFKIKKFASQGTATTFPVMSFVMLCIALGVSINGEATWTKINRLRSKVRVYGDDIILPTYGYVRLLKAMDLLQLKVNVAKSFVNGNFRESCGVDGFKGYDITPVSPKTIVDNGPKSRKAIVDQTNNLFNKGLWNASDSLKSHLPSRVINSMRIVGPRDSGLSGFTSYVGTSESHLRERRWNTRLHRYEVRTWGTTPRVSRCDRNGFSALLDFYASVHCPDIVEGRPRIVSFYAEDRGVRDGLRWEARRT